MKNLHIQLWIIILLNILPGNRQASGQAAVEATESSLLSLYFDEVYGADERLVSGPFYYGAMRGSIQGHPYYINEDWKTGSVEIGDIRFENLMLKYDILIKQFILKYITSNSATFQVGLRSGNITRITMGSHTFIPFPGNKDSTAVPFAELMSDGEIKYLITRTKYLVLTNGSGMTDYIYKENIRQFLYTDGQLMPFRGKATLLKLYPELKTELKQYARKNHLQLGMKKYNYRAQWIDHCNYLIGREQ